MTNLKSYSTITSHCPECNRKFSGRNKRTIDKLIALHCKFTQQTNINTDYDKHITSVTHSNKHVVCH